MASQGATSSQSSCRAARPAAMPASGPGSQVRRRPAPASQRGVGVQVAVGADQAARRRLALRGQAGQHMRGQWLAVLQGLQAFVHAAHAAGLTAGQQQRSVTLLPPLRRLLVCCAWLPPVTAGGGVFFFPERRVALGVIHDEFAGGKASPRWALAVSTSTMASPAADSPPVHHPRRRQRHARAPGRGWPAGDFRSCRGSVPAPAR